MDERIVAAITNLASAFLTPLLIAGGVAIGLAHGGLALVPRGETGGAVEPTPEPAQPAPPQVVVVTAPAVAPPAQAPPAPPRPGRPVFVSVGYSDVDDWFSVVDTTRDALLQLVDEGSPLMSSTRIVPHEEHGRVVGFRVYGIRDDSVLGALGLRTGDTVRSINGIEMASPESALEVYTSFRDVDFLDVRLTRRGRDARILMLLHDA